MNFECLFARIVPEQRDTLPDFQPSTHAHHLEGHNAALRRRDSAFQRRTHTSAKHTDALRRTLAGHLLQHHVVRLPWITGEVPAMRLGRFTAPLSLEAILMMPKTA